MRGFTLVEILITTAILSMILTVGMVQYNQFNRSQIVKQAAATLKNDLRLAQDKALAGEKKCTVCQGVDGVCGNSDDLPLDHWCLSSGGVNYQIYGECSATSFSSKTINLPTSVSLSVSSVCFKPITGGAEAGVTFTISAYGESENVVVSEKGSIE